MKTKSNIIYPTFALFVLAWFALSPQAEAVTLPLAPQENLLVNAGFETGDLTGWSIYPVTDGGVTNTEAHSGSYSMEMEAVDIIYQRFNRHDNLHAKSLRLWAKSNGVITGPAYATVYYLDGTSDQLSFGGSLSSTWTEFMITLTPRKVVIRCEIATGETDPVFVDDVQLRRFVP